MSPVPLVGWLLVPLLLGAGPAPPPIPEAPDPGRAWTVPDAALVDAAARSDLALAIEGLLRRTGGRSARWSVLAVSLDHGDTLFARHPSEVMTPASNVKLLTTAAALHHLGPDFRFRTLLLADGPVVDGILQGDLILYGSGDPALSDRFFESQTETLERLADGLLASGIREVAGNVVGDGTYFGGPHLGPGWSRLDLNDWFAAPVSALSFNENVATMRVEPASRPGLPPFVHVTPSGALVPVVNVARTAEPARRTSVRVGRGRPDEPVHLSGEISVGAPAVWRVITVSDPVLSAASALARVLEETGVAVRGGVRAVRAPADSRVTGRRLWAPALASDPGPSLVAVHRSPPLSELLAVVNKRSHNLYAELVLLTLGRLVEGDGSFEAGARVVERFLQSEVGVAPGQVTVADGSGLSQDNRATAAVFVQLLDHMSRSELWEPFWQSLPEAGNPRELRRMYRTAAARNLRAKTGTIRRVSALSGLVRSRGGERILFSILANDVPSTAAAKRVEDRIGVALASLQRDAPVVAAHPAHPGGAPATTVVETPGERGAGPQDRPSAVPSQSGGGAGAPPRTW